MQHFQLQEHIKVSKFIGFLIVSKGVDKLRGFGIILATRIFIEIVESVRKGKAIVSYLNVTKLRIMSLRTLIRDAMRRI